MASLVLDSSVWIALFVDDDPHHAKAAQFVASKSGTIYLPYVVLSEAATVITYKHSKAQAERFVTFLEADSDIVWLESDGVADRAFFKTISSKISFADATLLRLAIALKAELITYDQQLARLYRKTFRH